MCVMFFFYKHKKFKKVVPHLISFLSIAFSDLPIVDTFIWDTLNVQTKCSGLHLRFHNPVPSYDEILKNIEVGFIYLTGE